MLPWIYICWFNIFKTNSIYFFNNIKNKWITFLYLKKTKQWFSLSKIMLTTSYKITCQLWTKWVLLYGQTKQIVSFSAAFLIIRQYWYVYIDRISFYCSCHHSFSLLCLSFFTLSNGPKRISLMQLLLCFDFKIINVAI